MAVGDGERSADRDRTVTLFRMEQPGEDCFRQVYVHGARIEREIIGASWQDSIGTHHLVHVQAQARAVLAEKREAGKRDGEGHREECLRQRSGPMAGDLELGCALEICEDDSENSEVRQLEVIFYENNLFGKYSYTIISLLHLTQILHVAKSMLGSGCL